MFLQELLSRGAVGAVRTSERSLACVFERVSPKLKGVGGGVGTVGALVHLPNRGGDWPLARGSSSVTPLWVCLPLHLKRRLILLVIVMCTEGYICPTSSQHSTTWGAEPPHSHNKHTSLDKIQPASTSKCYQQAPLADNNHGCI